MILKNSDNNMETFQDILISLLETISKNPDSDINVLLAQKATEYGLSEKEIVDITAANELLDKFELKSAELNDAKKCGMTRESFSASEIERLVDGREDKDKDSILTAIRKTAESIGDTKK